MTTPSTERKAGPLLGTGAQTTWPFTFKVFAATDIAVTIANSLGVETQLVYGVDYTVTLNANQETSPGGTVTYPISGSPLPVSSRLVIVGNLPYDQPLDLPSGGNFSPLALENQLDRTVMQIQQLAEKTSRALQVSITTDADVRLPPPAASQLIGWDSTGENLENVPLSELGTAIAYGTYRYDTFTGDGATTNYALSEDPAALANLDVSISGVVQVPGSDYSLVNGSLVFASAPANGTTILARYGQALPALPDSDQITFVQSGAGASTRTVQSVLRKVIRVTDYANLAVMTTARSPGDPNSHLLLNFLNWSPAIQAALDEADARGGGTVILDKNTVPYYVQDCVYVKSNTTFIFDDWMILADYNLVGGTLGANGDNIVVYNVQIDNSNIYAGGSGYNGIGAQGKNIKFYGGHIKNCARGFDPSPLSPNDGGKGVQLEASNMESVVIDGITFSNCFMAMSTIRGFEHPENIYGIVYNNITADNCSIFFFVRQTNGYDQTGLEHSVQLNNFYAVNCGAFEGVFQFSRASNVKISNGTVVNDPGTAATALIRGHHANTTFDNVAFYGDAPAVIFVDPSTYAPDDSYPNANNRYNIDVWGTVQWLALSTNGTSYGSLDGCTGRVSFRNDPTTDWFSYDMRNGASVFEVSRNTGPFGQSKFATLSTTVNYTGSPWPGNFNELDIGNTQFLTGIGFVGSDSARDDVLDNYEQGTFTPNVSATSGSGAAFTSNGSYIRVGDLVTVRGQVVFTGLGTLSGRLVIGNLPFPAKSTDGVWIGAASGRFITVANAMSLACFTSTASYSAVTFPWTPNNGGGGGELQIADIAANAVINFAVTYRV